MTIFRNSLTCALSGYSLFDGACSKFWLDRMQVRFRRKNMQGVENKCMLIYVYHGVLWKKLGVSINVKKPILIITKTFQQACDFELPIQAVWRGS